MDQEEDERAPVVDDVLPHFQLTPLQPVQILQSGREENILTPGSLRPLPHGPHDVAMLVAGN